MATGKRKKRAKIPWKTLFYGMLIGTGAILLLVLLLTVFVYLDWLPETAVSVGNTVIRILVALAVGAFIGLARSRCPWWFGGIAAALSLMLAIAAMSVWLGTFKPSWNQFAGLLMSFAIGSAASALLAGRKAE
jgi:hypothetical protein